MQDDDQDQKQGGLMWLVLTNVLCIVGYLMNGFIGLLIGLAIIAGLYILILTASIILLNRKRW